MTLTTRAELAAMLHISERHLRRLLPKVPGLVGVCTGRAMLFDAANVQRIQRWLDRYNEPTKPLKPKSVLVRGSHFYALYHSTRRRAAKYKTEFSLTESQFDLIIQRAAGECELSGIPFRYLTTTKRNIWRPYAPSIDRVDSTKGYIADNCRLVCACVNAALGAWGDDVFWTMVNAAQTRGRKDCITPAG